MSMTTESGFAGGLVVEEAEGAAAVAAAGREGEGAGVVPGDFAVAEGGSDGGNRDAVEEAG